MNVGPRRTYIVSVYEGEPRVIVEAVQRNERVRLEDLEDLPERIREWERDGEGDRDPR